MRRQITYREHHDAWVAAWIAHQGTGTRPQERLALYGEAFAALWRRARLVLGDLTLSTLLERTLKEAAAPFPQLARLRIEREGLSLRDASAAGDPDLPEALRFLLVELLTALGKLTSEALTPALHRAVARGEPPRDVALPAAGLGRPA